MTAPHAIVIALLALLASTASTFSTVEGDAAAPNHIESEEAPEPMLRGANDVSGIEDEEGEDATRDDVTATTPVDFLSYLDQVLEGDDLEHANLEQFQNCGAIRCSFPRQCTMSPYYCTGCRNGFCFQRNNPNPNPNRRVNNRCNMKCLSPGDCSGASDGCTSCNFNGYDPFCYDPRIGPSPYSPNRNNPRCYARCTQNYECSGASDGCVTCNGVQCR